MIFFPILPDYKFKCCQRNQLFLTNFYFDRSFLNSLCVYPPRKTESRLYAMSSHLVLPRKTNLLCCCILGLNERALHLRNLSQQVCPKGTATGIFFRITETVRQATSFLWFLITSHGVINFSFFPLVYWTN